MSGPRKRDHNALDSPPAVFANKAVTITGAARGIGLATARYLLERGASLAISDILAEQVNEAAKELKRDFPGSAITSSAINVHDTAAVEAWLRDASSHYGQLDGCVNAAGRPCPSVIPTGPQAAN